MRHGSPSKSWIWVPALSWAFLVLVILSLPVEFLLTYIFPPSVEPTEWIFPNMDKFVHVLLFGIMAWLLFKPLKFTGHLTPMGAAGSAFAVAALYGLATEIIQHFIPYRNADIYDVMANAVGSMAVFFRLVLFDRQSARQEVSS